MRIENVPPSAQKKVKCGTWLEYWESYAKKKAGKCAVIGCDQSAEVGAQVLKPAVGHVTFIVPLCSSHAKAAKESMEVAESTVFVLANKTACED